MSTKIITHGEPRKLLGNTRRNCPYQGISWGPVRSAACRPASLPASAATDPLARNPIGRHLWPGLSTKIPGRHQQDCCVAANAEGKIPIPEKAGAAACEPV
ncbi:unnamed protein product [Acanthoscelides obtectus]|uniref:Uncharacterized protein n=1 Tax=Acanthoscelides obtectus TaxID=200917 RepID=A0A9P0K1Q7_ACAOB|nr:unnamed protein product [Acanthoscelides obtectus]CAK1665908.1 hypothetical protein AOBTE_LOCUS25040 [Acanthoscelides obtectus]